MGMVCLNDSYHSVVYIVREIISLLKILTDNLGGKRLPIDVNHHLEVLLPLGYRISCSYKIQNILVGITHQVWQLSNQFWLNSGIDYTLDVPLIHQQSIAEKMKAAVSAPPGTCTLNSGMKWPSFTSLAPKNAIPTIVLSSSIKEVFGFWMLITEEAM